MNSKRNFYIHLVCPHCHKGEALADGRAKVTISLMCPKCGSFFTADLDTLKTERTNACRRMGRTR